MTAEERARAIEVYCDGQCDDMGCRGHAPSELWIEAIAQAIREAEQVARAELLLAGEALYRRCIARGDAPGGAEEMRAWEAAAVGAKRGAWA